MINVIYALVGLVIAFGVAVSLNKKNAISAILLTVGLAVSLTEAILYTAAHGSWWALPVAAALFLAIFAFVGCIDLRPGMNDAVGWGVVLALSVMSGYFGLQILGLSSLGDFAYLGVCLGYSVAGCIGLNVGMKCEVA